ncbi:MAG TPA: CoA ester lyase, partial [Burkholderiaceae bacterium]
AGLASPTDGVSTAIDDADRLRADAERARRMGFGAKLCIHPKQVAPVQAAFSPTAAQVAWACRVRDAFAAARGAAVSVDGQMIDRPLNELALVILRRAAAAP